MGKTKSRRHKSKKPNPTGLPSVRDIEAEEEEAAVGCSGEVEPNADMVAIQSIVEQLQSVNVEDKECASWNLLTLLEDLKTIPLIVEHGIIKMIAPLLTDHSILVKHAVAGALRNLSVAGGPEICDLMVDNDVMTPLVALLKQIPTEWVPSVNKKEKEDTTLDVLIQTINLLWNLCESNSTAMKIFNQECLITTIYRFLNREVYGDDLAIVSAHCLHTVSEENSDAIQFLSESIVLEHLEKIIVHENTDSKSILLKVLASGIYLNTKNGRLTGSLSRIVAGVMLALFQSLDVNCHSSLEILANSIAEAKEAREDPSSEQHFCEDPRIGSMKDDIANVLSGQVVALEILTNICCSEELADDWDDLDCSDASDELVQDDDMEYDVACIDKFPGLLSLEVQEAIVSNNFSKKVIEKIFPLNEDIVKKLKLNPSIGQPLLKRLTTLHCRALLCIHNLVPCLDIEELGGTDHLYSCWINLGKLTLTHTYVCPQSSDSAANCEAPEHEEFLEAVTSSLRALLQKLIQVRSFSLAQLTWSDIQMLCMLVSGKTTASTRNNVINTIGSIGCTLAKREVLNNDIIKNIGLFLLELCGKDTELIVMAEAMDAIFDVFGEDNTDAIAQEINLVPRLRQTLPGFRHKIHNQKKTLRHHFPVVKTVLMNLGRFIKYKSELQQGRSGVSH